MSRLEEILKMYPEEEFLIADGFNGAIIGVCSKSLRVVYSIDACIEILMSDNLHMTEEDAKEHFHYNVEGAYVGDKTPIWVYDIYFDQFKNK
jgi:hypothetical protein